MDEVIAAFQSIGLTDNMATTRESELVKIFDDFSQWQQSQWNLETKQKLIASEAASIVYCDGELSSQTRNYLYDIDLLIPHFTQEPDTIIKIVKKTAGRALNHEIQRFITESTMPVDCPTLKSHTEKNTF